jgi:transposase
MIHRTELHSPTTITPIEFSAPSGSRLGTKRWVVERTIAWLHQYWRLRIRYERRDDIQEAFVAIACSLICLKR